MGETVIEDSSSMTSLDESSLDVAILERRYRHRKIDHVIVFRACANLVQAGIQLEQTVHQVDYNDNE